MQGSDYVHSKLNFGGKTRDAKLCKYKGLCEIHGDKGGGKGCVIIG